MVVASLIREDSVEGLVHDWRSAHPNLLDVLGAELADLLSDELSIPAALVHSLLRQAQVKVEIVGFGPSAVGFEGLEEL